MMAALVSEPLADLLRDLWRMAEADPAALASVRFTETDRSLPSSFHGGPLAAATIAAQALAAAQTWQARGGQPQAIEVSLRRALAMFRSDRYLTLDGRPPKDDSSPIFGYHRTADERWVQIHTHFPHPLPVPPPGCAASAGLCRQPRRRGRRDGAMPGR